LKRPDTRSTFPEWILLENDDYIIVNKPPWVSTLEDRESPVNMLKLARVYWPEAQACHRLDKETSGVLVFAKRPEAYRYLSMQFESRHVRKIYHAVVDGRHQFDEVEVNKAIEKKSGGLVRLTPGGSPSQTFFRTLQIYKRHTLVECRPVTGRMHQIRIHLTWLKAPIAGDEAYGGQPVYLSSLKRGYGLKKGEEERPLMSRLALHAEHIAFNSVDEALVEARAPYPKDMRVLLRQLASNA
jgi:23S rRNA pseudouridine955/2504/2580 synthase